MHRPEEPAELQGIRLTPRITLPEDAVEFVYASSSGPGGQNVNKKATKCQLRVRIDAIPLGELQRSRLVTLAAQYVTSAGEILIATDDHRSQGRNRDACIDKLSQLVREASVLPKIRRKTRPSRGSVERRLTAKKITGERKKLRRADD